MTKQLIYLNKEHEFQRKREIVLGFQGKREREESKL